jgi:hypothetical protein
MAAESLRQPLAVVAEPSTASHAGSADSADSPSDPSVRSRTTATPGIHRQEPSDTEKLLSLGACPSNRL